MIHGTIPVINMDIKFWVGHKLQDCNSFFFMVNHISLQYIGQFLIFQIYRMETYSRLNHTFVFRGCSCVLLNLKVYKAVFRDQVLHYFRGAFLDSGKAYKFDISCLWIWSNHLLIVV